jgi:hypothetical protein
MARHDSRELASFSTPSRGRLASLSMLKRDPLRRLSQLQFTTIKLGDALDMSSVNVSAGSGEFVMASLAKAVDKTEVNKLAVEAWLEKAQGRPSPLLSESVLTFCGESGCRSTLVFAVNIHHIVSLTNAFRDIGIDARFVHEGIHVRDREEIYQAFRRGEFPVLINCGELPLPRLCHRPADPRLFAPRNPHGGRCVKLSIFISLLQA